MFWKQLLAPTRVWNISARKYRPQKHFYWVRFAWPRFPGMLWISFLNFPKIRTGLELLLIYGTRLCWKAQVWWDCYYCYYCHSKVSPKRRQKFHQSWSKFAPKLVKKSGQVGQNLRPSWSKKVAKLAKSFAQVGFKKWSTSVVRFCFIDVFATFFKRDALDAVSKSWKSCFKSVPKLFQKCPKVVQKVLAKELENQKRWVWKLFKKC